MRYVEVKFTKNEVLPYLLGEIGYESFIEDGDMLLAYIQEKDFNEQSLRSLLESSGEMCANVDYIWSKVEDKDWNEEWEKEGFEPIVVADRMIIHDSRHLPEKVYPIDMVIDAKLAFGTGTHQTTNMMLQALMKLYDKHYKGRVTRLLDCGCGTGILGIAARKLGVDEVWAYDIDEWSVRNTADNSRKNETDNLHSVCGDVTVLGREIIGSFDIVMANINRNILLADVAHFSNVLQTGGYLVVSGFYQSDSAVIEREFEKCKLVLCDDSIVNDDWTCMIFRRV